MRRSMFKVGLAIVALCFGVLGTAYPLDATDFSGRQDKTAKSDNQKLTDATKQGVPLNTDARTLQDVSVEAVLLPERVCREVFGKEISQNYAAVELMIENHNRNAGLIVESIYIDFNNWALSGPSSEARDCPNGVCTLPKQISSIEYRIARGQMLDRQPWTFRNVTINGLQMLGSIATAYTFTLSGTHAIKAISAANGEAIPALDKFWPDPLIGQMNRVSDLGFKVNKLIPKESSDIIVAFFPIDRFLTPGFKKLFLKSPTLFFDPENVFMDRKAVALLKPDLQFVLGKSKNGDANANANEIARKVAQYVSLRSQVDKLEGQIEQKNDDKKKLAQDLESASNDPAQSQLKEQLTERQQQVDRQIHSLQTASKQSQDALDRVGCLSGCQSILSYLNQISLNNVRIVAEGVMTVDVNTVPASITSVDLDDGNTNAKSWTKGAHLGSITGSYLLDGTPALVSPPKGVEITAVKDGSTDNTLRFKLTLPDKFLTSSEQKLTFKVTKKDKAGKTTDSPTYDLSVPPQTNN
jgi:hypothetical protein